MTVFTSYVLYKEAVKTGMKDIRFVSSVPSSAPRMKVLTADTGLGAWCQLGDY